MQNSIDFDNQTDFILTQDFKEKLEEIFVEILENLGIKAKQCELIFVDNATIKEINKEYRKVDKETDVLSFPLDSEFSNLIGSVLISLDFAKDIAQKFNHSLEDEMSLLFIHGILHLLGYDHEKDNGEHREKEEFFIQKFSLPKSLIVRTLEL